MLPNRSFCFRTKVFAPEPRFLRKNHKNVKYNSFQNCLSTNNNETNSDICFIIQYNNSNYNRLPRGLLKQNPFLSTTTTFQDIITIPTRHRERFDVFTFIISLLLKCYSGKMGKLFLNIHWSSVAKPVPLRSASDPGSL